MWALLCKRSDSVLASFSLSLTCGIDLISPRYITVVTTVNLYYMYMDI